MSLRSFGVLFAVAALWWSTSSFGLGLGLGELKIESSLASPLRASIPLRGLAEIDLDPQQFSISVDSSANTEIEYRLEPVDADNANLILYTRKPISEPLFEFRVEVKWERSAVARSYDVFMDPPAYASNPPLETAGAVGLQGAAEPGPAEEEAVGSAQAAGTAAEAVAARDEAGSTAGLENQSPRPVADADAGSALAANPPEGGPVRLSADLEPDVISGEARREYGPAIDGNSIWRVARAVATDADELSIYQWMHAIWKANPGAFYQNNMHRLNMGELLVIPFEREVAESGRGEAYRAYSEQLAEFENASRPVQTAAVDDAPVSDDELAQSGDDGMAPTGISPGVDTTQESFDAATEVAAIGAGVSPAASTTEMADTAADGFVDGSAAGESDASSTASSEQESLRAVMALIEEIEANDASIIVNPALAEDVTAETQPPATSTAPEDSGSTIAANVEPVMANSPADSPAKPGAVTDAPSAGLAMAPAVTREAEPTVAPARGEWNNTLAGRREFIAGLPLIGAEASLSFVGRGIQRADAFIATSPSWAALAFGAWLTAIIVMLSRQIQSRRRPAVAQNLTAESSQTLLQTSPAPVMAPVAPVFDKLPLEQPKPRAPLKLPPRDTASEPAQQKNIDFNADEILTKADSFLQAKNSGEAIKLLELAIKLQPERIAFVVRLLEIFHQLKRADDFELLIKRFRPALTRLDREEQIHLQALCARLCPRAEALIDPDQAVEENQQDGDCAVADAAADAGAEADDAEYIDTQVIVMNNGVALEEGATGASGMVGTVMDLEDTLSEVDVYLAYGLYDNAEELLLKGMEIDPNRVDYLAKLLDTYYATGNLVDFLTCAEALHEMGDEALNEYWDKVEIMGYALAPYNELFAGGKGRSLDGVDLQISKPRSADIDPGGSDEPADRSADDTNPGDALADRELREEKDLDLDFKLETAAVATEAEAGSVESPGASSNDEAAAATCAEDEDEDSTDIDFDSEQTTNVNFSEDEPRPMDRLREGAGNEEADPDLSQPEFDNGDAAQDRLLQLEAVAGADPVVDADGREADDIGDSLQAADDDDAGDEAIHFTMPRVDDADPAGTDDKPAAELAYAASEKSLAASYESRILQFPDSGAAREANTEFEAEVKSTLQAMRDQLQYMTERLFRQERETVQLREALNRLRDGEDSKSRKGSKKSS